MILLELSEILPGIFTIHPTVVINNHTWPGIFHPSMSVFWHPENRSSLDILNHQMRFLFHPNDSVFVGTETNLKVTRKSLGFSGGDLTSTSYHPGPNHILNRHGQNRSLKAPKRLDRTKEPMRLWPSSIPCPVLNRASCSWDVMMNHISSFIGWPFF